MEDRRIVAKGRMTVDGELTAEAEGLFITIDALAEEYFGRIPARQPGGRPIRTLGYGRAPGGREASSRGADLP